MPKNTDDYTCPECGEASRVIDSRPESDRIRRRRRCTRGHRWTTYEIHESVMKQTDDFKDAMQRLGKILRMV